MVNYKEKIYIFIQSSEYHMITRIGSKIYGVVTLFTGSYGDPELSADSIEEVISKCKKRRYDVLSFDTYKEFFEYCLSSEENLSKMDFFGVKDLTGRHFYIEDNKDSLVSNVQKKLGIIDYEYEMLIDDEENTPFATNSWIPISIDRIKNPSRIEEYIKKGILRRI